MTIQTPVIFSIDAETIGLYGDHFAVGWSIRSLEDGKELESGYESCPFKSAKGSDDDRKWVEQNVCIHLPKEATVRNPYGLYQRVWSIWKRVKEQYPKLCCVVDCGYPVEARLFEKCVQIDESARKFNAPYPLHEVATALLMANMKSDETPRKEDELPEHHPTCDARNAGRLFFEAYHKINTV